jgi:hypothetical protein
MSIINRRNAVVGWFALTIGKRVLKRKAKDAPRPNKGAVAVGLLGTLGAAAFWRKRGKPDEPVE